MTANDARTPGDETVTLGVLPRTRGTRVAHPRPEFIGEAGALPIHDTHLSAAPGQMSEHGNPGRSYASFTASNVRHRRGGTDNRRTGADPGTWLRLLFTASRSIAAVIVAVAGYLSVCLAVSISTPGDRIGSVAVAAVIVSGLVLIVAQFVDGRSGR